MHIVGRDLHLQALHVQFLWQQSAASDCYQELGVLVMLRTTARADHKELLANAALCRSRLERWHGNYRTGIVLFLWPVAPL